MRHYLKDRWIQLKTSWSLLPLHKQRMIMWGVLIVSIVLVYAGMVSPFLHYISTLRHRIFAQQKMLLWIQAADEAIQQQENKMVNTKQRISPVQLLSFLQKNITQAHLTQFMTQLKQTHHDTIALQFEKVEFDKLMHWLIAIFKEQPTVVITHMSVTATNTPGVVNVIVVWSLGNSL